jgi:hypothetical protein
MWILLQSFLQTVSGSSRAFSSGMEWRLFYWRDHIATTANALPAAGRAGFSLETRELEMKRVEATNRLRSNAAALWESIQ